MSIRRVNLSRRGLGQCLAYRRPYLCFPFFSSLFFWPPCLWDLSFWPGVEFPSSEAVNIHRTCTLPVSLSLHFHCCFLATSSRYAICTQILVSVSVWGGMQSRTDTNKADSVVRILRELNLARAKLASKGHVTLGMWKASVETSGTRRI